ncbi:hypothetical protein [Nocardioides sp. AE5]|uniref:hypothetical protein n=1 Tax=Nocardioides sp. AE5 TaxID=2962573 RepID=UPI002881E869|nr:hypothetical protein [Nocardioides sp. AE5]MDT0202765.1 hypothetical protein [Nocardioides sp. AE5]
MYMSAEVITTLGSMLGMLMTVVGGFAWMIQRTDRLRDDMHAQFAKVDAQFAKTHERIDRVRSEIQAELAEVKAEVTAVKIAVARLEGPHPRLIVDSR